MGREWTRWVGICAGICAIGCPSAHRQAGDRGSIAEACFEDGTCAGDLECFRGICVLPERPDARSPARDAGSPRDASAGPTDAWAPPGEGDAGTAEDGGMPPPGRGLVPEVPLPPTDETGEVLPGPAPGIHRASAGLFDAVLDWERHRVFLSFGNDRIEVVDLVAGATDTVTIAHRAEHMFFEPRRDEVLVSLATREHSPYWFDDEQEGYVAAISADTLEAGTPAWMPLDPWDLVADGRGRAYVMGASGQWTQIATVDIDTGVYRLAGGPREGTNIEIHPDRNHIYGADNGLSPSDIERYELGATAMSAYDSPYHGDYPMCGDLRIAPSGDIIHTACGHVFLATNVRATDMTWTGTLDAGWNDLVFHPAGHRALVLREGPVLYVYDSETLAAVGSVPLAAMATRLLAGRDYFVLITPLAGGAPGTEVRVMTYASL
jgi:hypothetical protein